MKPTTTEHPKKHQYKAPMSAAIEVNNIYKFFNKNIKALEKVNLLVPSGKIFGLLGPNGAGKTTLVRILTTLLSPSSGTAKVLGLDVLKDAEKLRFLIGLTGQYAAVDENMTGFENLYMVGRLYHMSSSKALEKSDALLQRFDLISAAKRLVKTYSGGMRRKLDLAASLIADPKILFLDEPTTGLDPQSRIALWSIIKELKNRGTTILLTTQYLEEADRLADNLAVIDRGRIIAKGTPKDLKAQVGGDVVELHIKDKRDILRAKRTIENFGRAESHVDEDTGKITLPVTGGASILVSIIRKLDNEKIFIEDINLRRPTLDEVFLSLTGRKAEN